MQTPVISPHNKTMDRTAAFYASPTYVQRGGGIPIFSGSRRQRGGSILGAIKNFFMPLLPGLKNYAVKKAKSAVVDFTNNVATDINSGRPVGQSFRRGAIKTGKRVATTAMNDAFTTVLGSRKRQNTRKARRPAKRARKVANF